VTTQLRIDLLGPMRGWYGEQALDLGPSRQQSLLAVLALRANQVVGADELVELVWSDAPPATGSKIVPTYVYRLRKLLPDGVVSSTREGYCLQLAPDALDLSRFESLVSAGYAARAAGDLDQAAASLATALNLYSGEPLAGLAGHYLNVQRHRLTERRLKILAERIDLDLERGRYGDLVPELVALVEEDRLREQFAGQLMLAYWRSGRVSEALEIYSRARKELVDQLGVEPGPGLRAIHGQILANDTPATTKVPDELPYDGASFVGRSDELAAVVAALAPEPVAVPRVVAIDGMAGVGKTALAVRAARRLTSTYPDGRLFIDLHGYTPGREPVTPAAALDRLLRSLSVPADRIPAGLEERAALWRSELAGRRILVVLDNAPDSAAVRPLLAGSPTCGVVVTSRRQLGDLDATTRIALDVLQAADAAELLQEIVGADRVADTAAAEAVVEQCGYLPLAIRVAGSRLRHRPAWTVEHLSKRLSAQDRLLAELSVDGGGVSPAFALSYEHLPSDQQRLFRLLGLMTGQDIEQYAAANLAELDPAQAEDLLEALVDANLLQQPQPGRFQFHDLLRQYAASLLEPEGDQAVRRLVSYYTYAAADAVEAIFSSRLAVLPPAPPLLLPQFGTPTDGLAWGDAEGANILTTIRKALMVGLDEPAWRLGITAASYFFQRSRFDEMDELLDVALQAAERDPADNGEAVARVLISIGSLGRHRRGAEESLRVLHEARRRLPATSDLVLRARLLASIGYSEAKLHPDEKAIQLLQEALEVAQASGDLNLVARVLAFLGVTYGDRTEFAEALAAYEESLRIARKAGDLAVQGETLNGIGECLIELDRDDEAVSALLTARELAIERGADYTLLNSEAFLSTAYARRDDWPAALEAGRRSLDLAVDSGAPLAELTARLRLAETLLAHGEPDKARAHFHRALELGLDESQDAMVDRAVTGLTLCSEGGGR
jgi:DNA-binding SARP family transcriptional activator